MWSTFLKYHCVRLALAVLVTWGAPVHAQAAPAESASATTSVSVGVRRTSVRNRGTWMLGGDARVSLGTFLSVGGGAWALAEPLRITGVAGAPDLELAVFYVGALSEYGLAKVRAPGLALRLLVGAGSARVSLPVARTELAADNFGVLEPEVVGVLRLWSFFELRAGLGYRIVYGVEDLPQVNPQHLRGGTASLMLSLGPF